MIGSIGMPELIIILTLALIIFGPRKLPELGRSLGRSLGEFKRASNELRSTLDEEIRIEEQRSAQRQKPPEPQEAATAFDPIEHDYDTTDSASEDYGSEPSDSGQVAPGAAVPRGSGTT